MQNLSSASVTSLEYGEKQRVAKNNKRVSYTSGISSTSLFLLLVLSSLSHNKVNALSHGWGDRPSLRNNAKLPSAIPTSLQDAISNSDPAKEDDVSIGRPPSLLSSSPLFSATPSKPRRRHVNYAMHRKRFFARRMQRTSQLNYRDDDDEDIVVLMEERRQLRSKILSTLGSLTRYQRRMKGKHEPLKMEAIQEAVEEMKAQEPELAVVIEEDITINAASVQPPSKLMNFARNYKLKSKSQARSSPTVVTNVHELREAVLDLGLELRDVELKYTTPPSLLSSKKCLLVDGGEMESNEHKIQNTVQKVLDKMDSRYVGSLGSQPNLQNEESSILDEVGAQDMETEERWKEDEWQMIGNVLAENNPSSTTDRNDNTAATEEAKSPFSHDVLNLLHQRYHSGSTPSARAANDTSKLALSIEGGGMRGAVSGGMAAAICCLGLCDAFDAIYGSSAGSIIGSYFVSRQLYLDVYTDILPAGKTMFVRKGKIIGDIFRNMFHVVKEPLIERFRSPANSNNDATAPPPTRVGGLNISFVLDSIMCPQNGLRPLDLESFSHNDEVQPLRIVSSAVELETGKLKSICFGSKEGHFRDAFANHALNATELGPVTDETYLYPEIRSAEADENGHRKGLWACLAASMTVPGAAGSPWRMDLPSGDDGKATPHLCYDAFCYEPVPFRSAVEEGATHVLALRSRPAAFQPKTKPTLYERAVAPLYFKSHGVNTVAEFFERGGQQYLYAEDVLTLDEGLDSQGPIKIPPASVLYAAPDANEADEVTLERKNRNNWAEAHLLPITVPADVPELATLSQDRDDILAGLRSGFEAAFDMLAPVVGIECSPGTLDGRRVAELVFPDVIAPASDEALLEKQFELPGEKLGKGMNSVKKNLDEVSRNEKEFVVTSTCDDSLGSSPKKKRFRRWISSRTSFMSRRRIESVDAGAVDDSTVSINESDLTAASSVSAESDLSRYSVQDAAVLLSVLPGLKLGSLPLVVERLQNHLGNDI